MRELRDQYFDLRTLSAYSGLSVSSLRSYIRQDGLPHFRLKGKVLVRRSEFDRWMERFRCESGEDLNRIVDEVLKAVASD